MDRNQKRIADWFPFHFATQPYGGGSSGRLRRIGSKPKTNANRRHRRLSALEPLEERALLAVVWGEELALDLLGENEPVARQLIQRALDDWSEVILDFNFDGDNDPTTDNTLAVNIGIFPFLGGTRGFEATTEVDENGLPRGADIFLDDDGGSAGWFFDTTPLDDYEFREDLTNSFQAIIAEEPTNDFYRTIVHELGHAVGIAEKDGLAIHKFLTFAGIDQVGGTAELRLFHNPNGLYGSQGFAATGIASGGIHIYEGPVDPDFPDAPVHPGELMNPGRVVSPPPTVRQLISDVDAKILADAYGYDIRLPSTFDTFQVVLDAVGGQLYVQGEVGDSDDEIRIVRSADQLEVRVNNTVERVTWTDVTQIVVKGGAGDDRFVVDLAGDDSPIPSGGLIFEGGDQTGTTGDSLIFESGSVASVVHTVGSAGNGQFDIDGASVEYIGVEATTDAMSALNKRIVFGAQNDEVKIGDDGTPNDGVSRLGNVSHPVIDFTHPKQSLVIQADDGADAISVREVDAASELRLIVDTGAGADTISLQSGVVHATTEGTDDFVLESGDTLQGSGLVTGSVIAEAGSNIIAEGDLGLADLSNDGTLTILQGVQFTVGDLDNAGGILQADFDSTMVATGVISTGGLGEEKQFANLTVSGPGAAINGPLHVLGTLTVGEGTNLALNAAVQTTSLVTVPGASLDAGTLGISIGGDVLLADNTYTGGQMTLTGAGELIASSNTIGRLVIDHDGTTQANATLSVGSGGLTTRAGTLSLESDAAFDGPVVVEGGSFLVDPGSAGTHRFSFNAQVTVQEDAVFSFSGPASELDFAPGQGLVVEPEGAVRLVGSEADPLVLRSTSPGVAWPLIAAESDDVAIQFVDVRDSDASGSAEAIDAVQSLDAGDNVNWQFFDAFTVVHLDESGDLLIRDIDFSGKQDTVTLSTEGDRLVLEDPNNEIDAKIGTQINPHRVEVAQDLLVGRRVIFELNRGDDELTVSPSGGGVIEPQLVVNDLGDEDDDQLTVDLSDGTTMGGVSYRAGTGNNDSLRVIGTTNGESVLTFTPSSATFNAYPVDYAEVESAFFSNVEHVTYDAPLADNEIRIARPVGEDIILNGTVDGQPTTEFTFDDTGKISTLTVQGSDGSDHLILDHTSGLDPIPGTGITFHAGDQPADREDVLEILGGTFNQVGYEYESVTDGRIRLSDRNVSYTGVEPIINSGSSSTVLFDLTDLEDEAELVDAGGGNLSLLSINDTFQSTTLPTPSLRITVNGGVGDDIVAIGDLSETGFQGELRLQGEQGRDRLTLAPSHGIDIDARGLGEDLLGGYRQGPLVFSGGSDVLLSGFTISDFRDGEAAMQIVDEGTTVRLENVFLRGADDSLIEVRNGQGNAPPVLNLNSSDNTFDLESGLDGVAYVDNQTSPTTFVNLQFNGMELDVARNGNRTVRLTSDARSLANVTSVDDTHGSVTNNGDGTATYTPDADYVGPARFRYELSDSSTGIVLVDVVAANQTPVNTVPGAQTISEDSSLEFSTARGNPISISDPDAGNDEILVHLAASSGIFSVQRTGQMVVQDNHSGAVTLVGTVSRINATLDGMTFTPSPDFDDIATLTVTTDDVGNNGAGGALTDTDTIDVIVRGANDAPVQTLPSMQSTNEDTQLVFSLDNGNLISIADADANGHDIETTVGVDHGTLTLATTDGLTSVAGNGSGAVSMTGTLSDINAAIAGLVYSPAVEFSGQDSLTVTTNDLGHTGLGQAEVVRDRMDIAVVPINDGPVNSVPGSQTTGEHVTLVFSAADGNAIRVSDIDAGANDIEVTLSVSHGTVTLASTTGLSTISGDGTGVLTMTGTVPNINAALNEVAYGPEEHFFGLDRLTVRTNDLGQSGEGAALIDTDTIDIQVNGINDAPSVRVPDMLTTREDTPLVISQADGNPIVVSDVDAMENDVQLTLQVGGGVLTLATTDRLTDVSGDGTQQVTVLGSIANIGIALDGMVFTPASDSNGQTSLEISVDDRGHTGAGGPMTGLASVEIVTTAVNDGPIVTFGSNPVSVLESSGPQSFQGFVSATPGPQDEMDDGQAVVSVAITETNNQSLFSDLPTIDESGTLQFTPAPDAFGQATVTVTAIDDGGVADGGTDTSVVALDIIVVSTNNPPELVVPFSDVAVDEDAGTTSIDIGEGGRNFFADADGEPLTITAQSLDPGLVTASVVDDRLVLTYQRDQNGQAVIEVTASDAETSTPAAFAVTVNSVNDAPINRLPGVQNSPTNTDVIFSDANGNPISISDIDVGIGAVVTVLQVSDGILIVSDTDRANVTDNMTARVAINGPLAGVNAALNGLTYRARAGFSGTDTLSMSTDDLGNRGAGGSKTDQDELEIHIGLTSPVTADIVDVSPDPRAGSVNEMTVQFSRAVTGFDPSDLLLTRATDTTVNVPLDAATLTTSDNVSWTVGNLAKLTADSGIYGLTLLAAGTGISASDGGPFLVDAVDSWINGAGDANGDRRFDPLDLVRVLQADKYLTGLPALWSEGDWNGDGVFNPLDIVLAQQTQPSHYLQGPFAARAPESDAEVDDDQRVLDAVFGQM